MGVRGVMAWAAVCTAHAQPPAELRQPAATAAAPPLSTDRTLDAELREIDARAALIVDLAATFVQTKSSPLLKEPLRSSGTVKVRGERVLWETTAPRRTSMAIDRSEIRIFYPDQRVVEVYELDDTLRRITASPLPRLGAVIEQFDISRSPERRGDAEGSLAVDLVPRGEALRSRIAAVRVLIDRRSAVATLVAMTDADGEETMIRFQDARINQSLNENELNLVVPDGTRVSRSLEGIRPSPPTLPPPTERSGSPVPVEQHR